MTESWGMDVPTGRRFKETATSIRILPRATAKALAVARKTWPESESSDFERRGKLFVDKKTGVAYRRVNGDPQLGGADRAGVALFFVSADEAGDGVVYLVAADRPDSAVSTVVGVMEGRPALPHEAMR